MGKRIIAILLSALVVLSLGGCSVKKNLNEKIAEKVTESVLEKVAGDDVDIDIDIKDGGIAIKGEDGEEISFGSSKWPDGGAADSIPIFNKGNIISVINSNASCMIILEEVEEEDYKKYVVELKDAGFTNDVTEFSGDMGLGYFASLDEHTLISTMYAPDNKALSITIEVKK
ncbi:DUF6591 domain-containing protein [Natronincola peptidivorans]|nr:DUF6591 domain-containing protein [Natronincola peptidivorans]